MREGSSKRFSITGPPAGFQSEGNSLFWKILAISPFSSRFCTDPARSIIAKSFRINARLSSDRQNGYCFQPNSLFWNILRISPCGSRFYPDQGRSSSSKLFKMNILAIESKKNRVIPALSLSLRSLPAASTQISTSSSVSPMTSCAPQFAHPSHAMGQ